MAKKIKNLVNITPESMGCGPVAGCPAIYESADGSYVIIGKLLQDEAEFSELKKVITSGEAAIKIPKGLLKDFRLKPHVD